VTGHVQDKISSVTSSGTFHFTRRKTITNFACGPSRLLHLAFTFAVGLCSLGSQQSLLGSLPSERKASTSQFLSLGLYFSVVLKTTSDQVLVERGPYRFLRHPSYIALLLVLLGCGVMLGNWAATMAAFTVLLTAVVYRIRIEERALIASLGDAYRVFAKHRARLVPFIW
jgi:hypothetical protein